MNLFFRTRYPLIVAGIVALLAISTAAAFAADPVSSYREVLAALRSEKVVKVLVDLDHCSSAGSGKAGPPVEGGLVINAFNVVPGKGILFSDTHQTLDPAGKPITEYMRYDFSEDNKLTLTVTRLSANGPSREDVLVCAVPAGARFVW
jgi:VirK protein